MGVQFGIGVMRLDNVTIGHLQGVSLDFSFDSATLYSGSQLYPIDVRTHTGNITGNAEFANINAAALSKLLGGTINNFGKMTIDDTTSPVAFELLIQMETDNRMFQIDLKSVRSSKLSMSFSREAHVIPNFDFTAFANASGLVGYITLEDVS